MFDTPIGDRYSHQELENIWSNDNKIKLMRGLWISLATYQKELGISVICQDGLNEMKHYEDIINYDEIKELENKYKHDIVANINAFANQCPNASKFIHLGATSNFINDNIDLIRMRDSLSIIYDNIVSLFGILKDLSFKYKNIPTLAYTHFQRAQLTTVGKRFTMWNNDIYEDIKVLRNIISNLPFKGIKGTVGTEDSIVKLLQSEDKCEMLNEMLCKHYNFYDKIVVCGQTYSRKLDVKVIQCLSGICQSIYKMMNDIRLLASHMEILECFTDNQVGSSAMPYKKNPITCEKICSLSRYVINNEMSIINTYINQWLERSLDDSAIKRILLPEMFVLSGYIIKSTSDCLKQCYINEDIIKEHVNEHVNKIVVEEIIIKGVERGYNRQDLHERLRYCHTNNISIENDDILKNINSISINPEDYIGLCESQIQKFYNMVRLE